MSLLLLFLFSSLFFFRSENLREIPYLPIFPTYLLLIPLLFSLLPPHPNITSHPPHRFALLSSYKQQLHAIQAYSPHTFLQGVLTPFFTPHPPSPLLRRSCRIHYISSSFLANWLPAPVFCMGGCGDWEAICERESTLYNHVRKVSVHPRKNLPEFRNALA